MTKQYILISVIAIFMLESCEEAPGIKAVNSTSVLNGWEITKSTHDIDMNSRDLFFINSETGFVVGFNGDIYKTIDSGVSWQKQNSGTTLHLYSVYFLNQNVGFASGQAMSGCLGDDCDKGSVFLKTTDGGETWTKTFFKDYVRIKSLHFFNESRGLALIYTPDIPNSRDLHIAKTDNGGDTWEFIDLAIKPSYNKFFCVDDVVFIAGENQKIFKSTNFGDNWETINTPIPAWNDVRNIYFYNESIGFVDGVTNLHKTIDGGLSWETIDFPFSSFDVVHFFNETEGFNIEKVSQYEGGEIPTFKGSQSFQTSNGGETWIQSDLNKSLSLGLTYFPQRDLGYGVNFPAFYVIKKEMTIK
ncbi:MAG TPA: hypothetical protein VD927_13690 [Chryseosolibacter sp.]|nr:hypothetical protein [Chryseosolibacter sp.]